ncbi:MAG: hypothetical protein CVV37_02655 [Nitrospira bacterium HGW-Nitrospira-1]|nr:MAG: hypothetical protein CVV37_02655 [Nitrospira bacterium HGW-Nitrospira-1]
MVMSLVLLNLAGGDSVDDINKLEGDEGFCRIMRKVEEQGLTRKERLELKKRWRKGRTRTLPSSSALFRYLASFHDAGPRQHQASLVSAWHYLIICCLSWQRPQYFFPGG